MHAHLKRLIASWTILAAVFGTACQAVKPSKTPPAQPPDAPKAVRADAGLLHGQYLGGHVWLRGVFRPPAAAPSGAHLIYHGGRVISNAQIVQVIWGSGSYLPQVTSTASPSIASFFQGILNSAYMDWLTEYDTPASGGTNQKIGRGSFRTQVRITPSAANNGSTIDDTQIQKELDIQITAGSLPAPTRDAAGNTNTIYMIYFPHGKTISLGGSFSCQSGGFCAYHSTIQSGANGEYYYGVFPDMQAGSGCDTGCGTAAAPFGNYTSVASHELIEAITDAEVGLATDVGPPLAWYDSNNGQIGDICNAQQGTIVGGDGVTYVVQKEFSNAANDCIISTGAAAPTRTRTPTPAATHTPTRTTTRTANTPTRTPTSRLLSSLSPAKAWIGLVNTADAGLRLDVRANVSRNGILVGSGTLSGAGTGSSGFSNAILDTISLTLTSGPVAVASGDRFAIEISARNACSGSSKSSGRARLWYNGAKIDTGAARNAGSRFDATIGGSISDYFLRANSALSKTAGSARTSVDAAVGARCGPFVSLGTWSTTLQ
jgi:hypothetical protein